MWFQRLNSSWGPWMTCLHSIPMKRLGYLCDMVWCLLWIAYIREMSTQSNHIPTSLEKGEDDDTYLQDHFYIPPALTYDCYLSTHPNASKWPSRLPNRHRSSPRSFLLPVNLLLRNSSRQMNIKPPNLDILSFVSLRSLSRRAAPNSVSYAVQIRARLIYLCNWEASQYVAPNQILNSIPFDFWFITRKVTTTGYGIQARVARRKTTVEKSTSIKGIFKP